MEDKILQDKIDKAIEKIRKSTEECSIYIGCDSKVFRNRKDKTKKRFSKYRIHVWVHRNSCNGAYCIFKHNITEEFYGKTRNIQQRLLKEVELASNIAVALQPHVGNRRFEIHLDINSDEHNRSNEIANMAMGYVQGMTGIKPMLKPNSPAASFAADRAVNNKMKWSKVEGI